MRTATLVFVILCASVGLGNTRQWKDAKVIDITSDTGGAAAASTGTLSVAVPINRTFYWVQTADTTYVLGPAITPCGRVFRRCPYLLNVTLHGKTKIAIDGKNAHILDDEGKDEKIPIAEKIARTDAPAETPAKP